MHFSLYSLIFYLVFHALFWLRHSQFDALLLDVLTNCATSNSIFLKSALIGFGQNSVVNLMPAGKQAFLPTAMNIFLVGFYAFFWLIRINGCIRRGRQPLLRGREWFFNVHVQPHFYTGVGRRILHRYWMRMLIPFAVDIPFAAAIFLSGRLPLLNILIIGLCALIHINHSYSVHLAERQAQPFAIPEAEQPVASIALSLKPRRLRDYSNRKLEWAIGLMTAFTLIWLLRYYFAGPEPPSSRRLFAVPLFLLYVQVGGLFVKCIVLARRTPAPQAQAAECLEAREESRKYYVKQCDWIRASATAAMLFSLVQFSVPPPLIARVVTAWLAVWAAITFVATIWQEMKRKQLLKLSLRVRPVKLPDFLHQTDIAPWPLCYQPSIPMLILKGAHGYSLNLANRLIHLGTAYLAGLVTLFVLLFRAH